MDRFAVIGLGKFGMELARRLSQAGAEVIAVDRERALVEEIRDEVSLAVALDSTDEEALRAQGIDKVDVAVVGIGTHFEAAVLTTVILKALEVPRVIARATTEVRAKVLSRVGADDVINPERESAERWRNRLLAPTIMERMELAEGYSLAQVTAPESFFHKTLAELDVRRKYKVNVVAIRRTVHEEDERGIKRTRDVVVGVPSPDSPIKPDDILVVIGSDEAINGFPRK